MSWIDWTPWMSRCLEVKAEMAIGTCCRFCSRFSAVTTISPTGIDAPGLLAATCVGRSSAQAHPANAVVAATDEDSSSKRLICMAFPQLFVARRRWGRNAAYASSRLEPVRFGIGLADQSDRRWFEDQV